MPTDARHLHGAVWLPRRPATGSICRPAGDKRLLQAAAREKAVRYLRQAGLEATARSSRPDARASFEQALGVLDTLPDSQATLEQGFEIHLELRPVLVKLGKSVEYWSACARPRPLPSG